MTWTRAALALIVAVAVGVALVSGGSNSDPRTPAALPGLPPPFLGTAVSGSGAMTASVDAYGDVVDLRPSPAGPALIDNPSDRQMAGTVPADTGIVPGLGIDGREPLAPWSADSVAQRYLRKTNVVRTLARFGGVREAVTVAAAGGTLVVLAEAQGPAGVRTEPSLAVDLSAAADVDCRRAESAAVAVLICDDGGGSPGSDAAAGAGEPSRPESSASFDTGFSSPSALKAEARKLINRAAAADRAWLGRARSLGPGAPAWARAMYERSLLTLRASTAARTGAVAAGARDGWAYVWPRDAATVALAYAAAGYRAEARRVARFLARLDLAAAARFDGDGEPVPGRAAQGDASGWVEVAERASGRSEPPAARDWRDRADYREGAPGDYLANAIASSHGSSFADAFRTRRGFVRESGDPGSGLDTAAAWAVRPFPHPSLFPAVRRTLGQLAAGQTRFGLTPGESWPGTDPWAAPTAWSAWAFAALARESAKNHLYRAFSQTRGKGPTAADRRSAEDRRQALRLLGDLRRSATAAGALPERVDVHAGIPRSTTPLAWPHAFAVLALQDLWPDPGSPP